MVLEQGVNTKFGAVAHGIKPPIPTPHSILDVLDFLKESCLVMPPVAEDSREQKILLMEKECTCNVR